MIEAINLYANIVTAALPYGIAFAVGDLIIGTLFSAAFGGKLKLK